MNSLETNYYMAPKREKRFCIGDLVCWKRKKDGKDKLSFGIIIFQYCEETRMKNFLHEKKNIVFDNNSKELKEFYVNEVRELGNELSWEQKVWTIDDRYLKLISYGKSAKA